MPLSFKTNRLPSCPVPGSLHLMLVDPSPAHQHQAGAAAGCDSGCATAAASSIHHLASLPILPPAVVADARQLLRRQIAAAPTGARAALRCLGCDGAAECADVVGSVAAPAGDPAPLPPPGLWPLLPATARAAIMWAWRGHFAPFARDLCYVLDGPGPADARACLLASMLRFAGACGMTSTALHLLRTCARTGVITLVGVGPRGGNGGVVPAPGFATIGFIVKSADVDGQDVTSQGGAAGDGRAASAAHGPGPGALGDGPGAQRRLVLLALAAVIWLLVALLMMLS
jgi:hypothetical protein